MTDAEREKGEHRGNPDLGAVLESPPRDPGMANGGIERDVGKARACVLRLAVERDKPRVEDVPFEVLESRPDDAVRVGERRRIALDCLPERGADGVGRGEALPPTRRQEAQGAVLLDHVRRRGGHHDRKRRSVGEGWIGEQRRNNPGQRIDEAAQRVGFAPLRLARLREAGRASADPATGQWEEPVASHPVGGFDGDDGVHER